MRKNLTGARSFKGSVFVEFKEKSKAEELATAKDVKYEDSDLVIEWK